jgi:hypothetical protein
VDNKVLRCRGPGLLHGYMLAVQPATSFVVLSNVSLVSLDSGAGERSPDPNYMVSEAEGEALKEHIDIGPLVGIERGFLTGGSGQAVEGRVALRLYMIKRQRPADRGVLLVHRAQHRRLMWKMITSTGSKMKWAAEARRKRDMKGKAIEDRK